MARGEVRGLPLLPARSAVAVPPSKPAHMSARALISPPTNHPRVQKLSTKPVEMGMDSWLTGLALSSALQFAISAGISGFAREVLTGEDARPSPALRQVAGALEALPVDNGLVCRFAAKAVFFVAAQAFIMHGSSPDAFAAAIHPFQGLPVRRRAQGDHGLRCSTGRPRLCRWCRMGTAWPLPDRDAWLAGAGWRPHLTWSLVPASQDMIPNVAEASAFVQADDILSSTLQGLAQGMSGLCRATSGASCDTCMMLWRCLASLPVVHAGS